MGTILTLTEARRCLKSLWQFEGVNRSGLRNIMIESWQTLYIVTHSSVHKCSMQGWAQQRYLFQETIFHACLSIRAGLVFAKSSPEITQVGMPLPGFFTTLQSKSIGKILYTRNIYGTKQRGVFHLIRLQKSSVWLTIYVKGLTPLELINGEIETHKQYLITG